ncbi:MAG: AAA family ATPase [Solirubrobacterales bacterium]|nr:AAA family ATPase [Solirubrobacterales bacterium]
MVPGVTPTAKDLLQRELIFVTGKGGVGKTTVAAGLGMALAAAGRRTIVCEVGAQRRLPALYGRGVGDAQRAKEQHEEGEELRLDDELWATSVDPNRALRQWLGTQLPSKGLADLLSRSNLFQYFTAAAPGARELVTVTKVWELSQAKRWEKKAEPYDTVVVDLPASGHGVGLLRTARTFADVARVGPIASQAGKVRDAVEDPARSAVVAVCLPGELPVTETLELETRVQQELRRPVDAIVVNALLARRWRPADLEQLEAAGDVVPAEARRAARSETARTRAQQTQLARLRRDALAPVTTVPFVPSARLGREQIAELGAALAEKL